MSLNPLQELVQLIARGMAREIVAQAKQESVKTENPRKADPKPEDHTKVLLANPEE